MNEILESNQLEKFMDLNHLRESAIPQKVIFQDEALSNRYVQYLMDDTNAKGSRRDINIQKHVDWMCTELFKKNKNTFLDLGCGVGQYSKYLVKNGNVGYGVDIIESAIKQARLLVDTSLCEFVCADFLDYEFPEGLDVVIFTYSVFNHLSDEQARRFLKNVYDSLLPGGIFYFEPLTYIPKNSLPSHHWELAKESLFFREPHLSLLENHWSEDGTLLTVYKYLLSSTGKVSSYYDNFRIYTIEEYEAVLLESGFTKVSLCNIPYINTEDDRGYLALVAYK